MRARPEADAHPVLDERGSSLGGDPLLSVAIHGQRLQVDVEQIGDASDRDVGRGMRRGDRRVVGELPLERQHRRHAVGPCRFAALRIRTLSSTRT